LRRVEGSGRVEDPHEFYAYADPDPGFKRYAYPDADEDQDPNPELYPALDFSQ